MSKFKYRIINNERQYLTNDLNEYINHHNPTGASLNIEVAPRDGWFDSDGNRRAMSRFHVNGVRLRAAIVEVVLRDWTYSSEFENETEHSLDYLLQLGLLNRENVARNEGGSEPIFCTHFINGYTTEILFTRGEKHLVRTFVKKWRNIVRLG